MERNERGFTFIEILVVTGIIAVLVGMVAVLVPTVILRGQRTESVRNAQTMASFLADRSLERGWPPYEGKAFLLSLVASRVIDPRNDRNLEVFFAPGDAWYTLEKAGGERYRALTLETLKAGADVHDLTSYAARRNTDRDWLITGDKIKMGVPVLCDDDDGPVHDPDGLVIAFTDGSARHYEWADLGMEPPEKPDDPAPFLGDDATDARGWLAGLSAR